MLAAHCSTVSREARCCREKKARSRTWDAAQGCSLDTWGCSLGRWGCSLDTSGCSLGT